jgi:S-adenosylmethionine:tRNA ribosyltransferase-isomerase
VTSTLDALDFDLPSDLVASEPPEARGGGRDDVRLMVSWRHNQRLAHLRFAQIPDVLVAGDVLVVNTSATLAASLDGQTQAGLPAELHLSTCVAPGLWTVELRHPGPAGSRPWLDAVPGTIVALAGGGWAELLAPADGSPQEAETGVRLWAATVTFNQPELDYLAAHGRPIRYGYVPDEWGLAAYQTVFATDPGSAEMPSAGRPFTTELVTRLVTVGVEVAPLVLHAGVSSAEAGEPPAKEWYRVPPTTARRVTVARADGRRVIAVGTTPVRALETVAAADGSVSAGEGWTDVVITPERGVRAVDGMLTGWHEPRASHLAMIEAVAGRELLVASYRAGLDEGYRWHEFGDSLLILP